MRNPYQLTRDVIFNSKGDSSQQAKQHAVCLNTLRSSLKARWVYMISGRNLELFKRRLTWDYVSFKTEVVVFLSITFKPETFSQVIFYASLHWYNPCFTFVL